MSLESLSDTCGLLLTSAGGSGLRVPVDLVADVSHDVVDLDTTLA